MVESNKREFLFAQKYRPRVVDDCIIPQTTKDMVKAMLAKGEISHLLFTGGPGMGKTTLAYAIANELGSDILYINASMENGIDILRTKIQSFASTISLSDTGPKLVILDEADGATPQFQSGLKGFLESFSANCRFIFTANIKHKIIEPIQSRCTVVDFNYSSAEKPKIAAKFYKRVVDILNTENVQFETKVVAKLVEKNFPDFRCTLNELQRHSATGKIDADILNDYSADNVNELIGYLASKDFGKIRQWVGRNEDMEPATIFRSVYESAVSKMKPEKLPVLVLILADYGYKSVFCIDQQINTMAAMTEIISGCDWL